MTVITVVSLAEQKLHMNIGEPTDDEIITDKLLAAEQWIAKFLGAAVDDSTVYPGGTPEPLKEAIRQLAAHLYENREATIVGVSSAEIPFGVMDLMAPYRTWVF